MSEKEVIPLERQTGASCSLQNCPEKYGVLPACAGLAVPYVPFQQEDPPKYSQSDALRNGTLFPYLNLPFFRMVEGSTLPGGPMAQLQALEFVLVELGAYLDTHPADAEGGLQTQYVIPRRVHIRFRAVQIAGRSAPAQKCRRIRQRRAEFGGEMEIYVGKNAKMKYSTIQNWSREVYNLVTKRSIVEDGGFMQWLDGNVGSYITMKYPSAILKGDYSSASSISISYAHYFNVKYDRAGHLFQDRFRSETVNDMEYFTTLIRYIHQNPVASALVSEVKDYQWSSWCEYDNRLRCYVPVCSTNPVLEKFSFDVLEEMVNDPLPKTQRILDIDRKTNGILDDDEVRDFIQLVCHIQTIADVQQMPRNRRNEVLKMVLEYGASIRQLSRVTGVSRGVIGKL